MEENRPVDNIGNLIVSDEVVASIALNAAKDVEGVSGFAVGTPDVHSILKLDEGPLKVVHVASKDNDMKIYIHVLIEPGKKIPNVAAEIQKNVKDAVQNMTGQMVSKVNVIIEGMGEASKQSED